MGLELSAGRWYAGPFYVFDNPVSELTCEDGHQVPQIAIETINLHVSKAVASRVEEERGLDIVFEPRSAR